MDRELEATRALLFAVFGDERYRSLDYLEWLYAKAPEGRQIECNEDDAEGRIGHYVVVPQTYHRAGAEQVMALSLNTAVAPRAQGRGLFTRLASATYGTGSQARGTKAVIGVANANSTPGFLGKLGFTLLGPLPVVVGYRLWPRAGGVETFEADAGFAASESFRQVVGRLDLDPCEEGWSQKWTAEKLAWRLSSPIGRYRLHVSPDGAMVTTTERVGGFTLVIVLKAFCRLGISELEAAPLLSAACRSHGTGLYLYAGFNSRIRIRGIPAPRRFLPSPLNLIYRPLSDDAVPAGDFKLATFEFLDFDPY
ncbi:MAG: GNAT family N-acetyltransferase [Lysobacter sp.]|nr:GNAT family N-acetyltransferase [Lysobacter sp.]